METMEAISNFSHTMHRETISEVQLPPYEIVFGTMPRIPIDFEINLHRDSYRNCTPQYSQDLPLHPYYDKLNLNPFFDKILSKPLPQWISAAENAMIRSYHTVYEKSKRKINLFACSNKTYKNPRPW